MPEIDVGSIVESTIPQRQFSGRDFGAGEKPVANVEPIEKPVKLRTPVYDDEKIVRIPIWVSFAMILVLVAVLAVTVVGFYYLGPWPVVLIGPVIALLITILEE